MLTKLPRNPTSTLLILPFDKPPLNLNDRSHYQAKARVTRSVREATVWVAKRAKLPKGLSHVWVELVYRAPDRRVRDSDNLVATLKPVADALTVPKPKHVGYGVVPDDTPQFMTKLMPVILTPDDERLPQLPLGATGVLLSWEDDERAAQ